MKNMAVIWRTSSGEQLQNVAKTDEIRQTAEISVKNSLKRLRLVNITI